jgi:hypothetical protein
VLLLESRLVYSAKSISCVQDAAVVRQHWVVCQAMVFGWSRMNDGDPNYSLTQVATSSARCMGGSDIRSALAAIVGLCSRWQAGNLLQRACGAVGLWGLYGGDVGYLCGPGIAGVALRLLYRKSGGLVSFFGS